MPGSDKVQFPVPVFKIGKLDAETLLDAVTFSMEANSLLAEEDMAELEALSAALEEFLA